MYPEMWFWRTGKRFPVGFQILQKSHNSKLAISSFIFPIDFFFSASFAPFPSNFELNWKLKAPAMFLLPNFLTLSLVIYQTRFV